MDQVASQVSVVKLLKNNALQVLGPVLLSAHVKQSIKVQVKITGGRNSIEQPVYVVRFHHKVKTKVVKIILTF